MITVLTLTTLAHATTPFWRADIGPLAGEATSVGTSHYDSTELQAREARVSQNIHSWASTRSDEADQCSLPEDGGWDIPGTEWTPFYSELDTWVGVVLPVDETPFRVMEVHWYSRSSSTNYTFTDQPSITFNFDSITPFEAKLYVIDATDRPDVVTPTSPVATTTIIPSGSGQFEITWDLDEPVVIEDGEVAFLQIELAHTVDRFGKEHINTIELCYADDIDDLYYADMVSAPYTWSDWEYDSVAAAWLEGWASGAVANYP